MGDPSQGRGLAPGYDADLAGADVDIDVSALRVNLSGRLIGRRIDHHKVLSSTMDEVRRLAAAGDPEGVVVVAEEQRAGRGRFSRRWIAPPRRDIAFSVLLRPTLEQLPQMNMAATLAVLGAIRNLAGLSPSIKWPNDVRVNGLKISGILVETDVSGGEARMANVGVGINVNSDPTGVPEIASTATSVLRETGSPLSRTSLLREVLELLDGLYGEVVSGATLTERWAAGMATLGRVVSVRWGERVVTGRALSVDDGGNLLLESDDGREVLMSAGEVTSQV